ncbi:MAG: hypothetical protein QW035_01545 [Candidatus Anstonellales archaeon]
MQQLFSLFSTLISSNYFILALAQGFLVKFADETRSVLAGLIYGIISAAMIVFSPVSSLWAGATMAQAFAGKIDAKEHMVPFALSLAAIAIANLNMPLVAYFIAAAWADEIIDAKIGHRPLLIVAALPLYNELHYFIGIACFDFGYLLAKRFSNP